jgi:hypothetical protein
MSTQEQNHMPEINYIYLCPTHVVVDTLDGYTFAHDGSGVLFDGPRAAAYAEARNNEQNPGFKSYQVFYLADVPTFEPRTRPDSPRWVCGGCGQEWPAQSSAQIIAQNARAAVTHPGIGCQPTQDSTGLPHYWEPPTPENIKEMQTSQCDAFDCDDQHELAHKLTEQMNAVDPIAGVDGE